MLDLSWGEIVLIGAVAVIFIGPKELPNAVRTMGKFMGKARTMAREFQNNVDDMIREADLEEVKKQVQSVQNVTTGGLSGAIQNAIDPKGEIQKALAPPETLSAPAISELPPPPAPAPAVAAPPVESPATVPVAAKTN
jgi:sec-independent protein translocase protein TatB